MSWCREDAAATMDGRYRLSYSGQGVAGKLGDRALSFERFRDARGVAVHAAKLRPAWVIFVEQGGKIVWASDGRECARKPQDF